MHYNEANIIAEAVFSKLYAHCKQIHIAGSIRRKALEVGDIEIVCLPRIEEVGKENLFGEIIEKKTSMEAFEKAVATLGTIIKGKPTGKYMQIALHEGINLDLFMPNPADYYRQLAIRTGSADYSYKVIARSWRRLGWVGTAEGLRKASECVEKKNGEKSFWKCTVSNPTLPPKWNSEQDFFAWLEVPYLEPKYRFTDNVRM